MFDRWGYVTDGRTGLLIGYVDDKKADDAIWREHIVKACVKAESETGISPLYAK
jgi:hypothetical protein